MPVSRVFAHVLYAGIDELFAHTRKRILALPPKRISNNVVARQRFYSYLHLVAVMPTCSDDLLLHFPYEDHYNDVTCHKAIATQYGDGVSLEADAVRGGNVACFTGDTHFEVCLWPLVPTDNVIIV